MTESHLLIVQKKNVQIVNFVTLYIILSGDISSNEVTIYSYTTRESFVCVVCVSFVCVVNNLVMHALRRL